MSKFKIGDKIVTTRSQLDKCSDIPINSKGTVVTCNNGVGYTIKWDKYGIGSDCISETALKLVHRASKKSKKKKLTRLETLIL